MKNENDELTELSDWDKAHKTDKWAEIMTKVAIARINKRWERPSFRGLKGRESRGIVDLIAIRKNQTLKDPLYSNNPMKPGDLFDIILIQVKGGAADWPSENDRNRLFEVSKYHHAKCCILAKYQKGNMPDFFRLVGSSLKSSWDNVKPEEIFK